MYYVLRYDGFSDTEALSLPRPVMPDPDMAFHNGVVVVNAPKLITFTMTARERGDLGDWVPTGLPGLVISMKFKEALHLGGADNVQYIPAAIYDEVGKHTHTDYVVANVIGVVDCIDLARSKLTMRAALPDKIRDINELHIDEARAAEHTIFRLARKSSLVLVSEQVKATLDRAGLRGPALVEAEGFAT